MADARPGRPPQPAGPRPPIVQKVIAYVLRFPAGRVQLAVFRHRHAPEAGVQVPAGTVEPAESPEEACLREVEEESGIRGARLLREAGVWDHVAPGRAVGQRRHVFVLAAPDGLPESWAHAVSGEGLDRGMVFDYAWMDPGEAMAALAGDQGAYLERAVLPIPFRAALLSLASDLARERRVSAALLFGSAQSGAAGRRSDLDIVAVTLPGGGAWHEGRVLDGVQVELAFSPPEALLARIASAHPVTVAAFAGGSTLFDRRGVLAPLRAAARAAWSAGPPRPTPAEVLRWRYQLTDRLLDLEDAAVDDAGVARRLAGTLVPEALDGFLRQQGAWPAGRRRLTERCGEIDADLRAMVGAFYANGLPAEGAVAIVERVLGPWGGRLREYRTEPR